MDTSTQLAFSVLLILLGVILYKGDLEIMSLFLRCFLKYLGVECSK